MRGLDVARKLDTIAENMKDLQIKGTTRIDWYCLTEREKRLFERVMEIKDKYWPQLWPPLLKFTIKRKFSAENK